MMDRIFCNYYSSAMIESICEFNSQNVLSGGVYAWKSSPLIFCEDSANLLSSFSME